MKDSERAILQWMQDNLRDESYLRYDHVHLTQMDSSLERVKTKDKWFTEGVNYFLTAVKIRNSQRISFSVGLAYDLGDNYEMKGVNFTSKAELIEQFDKEPPSIYIFPYGSEPWVKDPADFVTLDPGLLDFKNHNFNIKYSEIKFEDEYRRSLWLVG